MNRARANVLTWWASLLAACEIAAYAVRVSVLRHSPDWVVNLDSFLVGLATWWIWDAFVPRNLSDRASQALIWCGVNNRTPMGVDDAGHLVPYDPDLHSTEDTRLMLAEIRAWTETRFEDAT